MGEWDAVGHQALSEWDAVDHTEEPGLLDRLRSGLKGSWSGLGNTVDTIGSLAAAVPAGLVKGQAEQDKLFKALNERIATRNEWAKDVDPGFVGKLAGTVATLPAQMLTMPASHVETGKNFLDQGESGLRTAAAMGIDAAGNALGMGLPNAVGKTLFSKVATGAGINALQDYATKYGISSIAQNPTTKEQYAPSMESAALAGVVGAGFGAQAAWKDKKGQKKVSDVENKFDALDKTKGDPQWEATNIESAPETFSRMVKDLSPEETVKREVTPIDPFEQIKQQAIESGDQQRYAQAQAAIDARQKQMEFETARQALLDRNAQERTRQEQAPTGQGQWAEQQRQAAEQRQPGDNTPVDFTNEPAPHGLADTPYQHEGGLDYTQHAAENLSYPIVKQGEERLAWDQRNAERLVEDTQARRVEEARDARELSLVPFEEALRKEAYKPSGDGQGPKTREAIAARNGRFGQGGAIHPQLAEDLYKMGNSVIRGVDGLLKVLYHGTSSDKIFGSSFKKNSRGIFLTDDPKVASQYAKDNDSKNLKYNPDTRRYEDVNSADRVVPVYADIRNPYTLTSEEVSKYQRSSNYAKSQRELMAKAIATGHDGIIYPDGAIVAAEPSQIKSALSHDVPKSGGKFGQGGSAPIISDISESIVKGFKALGTKLENLRPSIPLTKEQTLAKLPQFADLKNFVPKGDTPDTIVSSALSEGKDGPSLWNNVQSGLILSGDKVKSAAMTGVGRWLQYGQKIGELGFKKEVQPIEAQLRGLTTANVKLLNEAMKREQLSGRSYTPDDLRSVGLSDSAIKAYDSLRAGYDKVFESQNAFLRSLGKKEMTKQDMYYSSVWHGDWYAPVLDKNGNLAWWVRTTSRGDAKKALSYLQEKFGDTLQVDTAKIENRSSNISSDTPRDVIGAYQNMLEFFSGSDISSQIKEAMNDYAKERGFTSLSQDKHFKHKAGIRGFEGDQPWLSEKKNAYNGIKAQVAYLKQAYQWMGMQEAMSNIKDVISNPELNKQQPNNMELIKSYVNQQLGINPNVMKPIEQATAKLLGTSRSELYATIGDLKSLTYLQQLGLSAGYMIATPLQGLISVPAWNMKLSKDGFGLSTAKAAKAYGLGISDAAGAIVQHYINAGFSRLGKDAPDVAPISAFGKKAMEYAEVNGIINKNIFDEQGGLGQHKAVEGLKQALGGTISLPEHIVRTFAFMSFAQHLKESGKMSDMEAFRKAEEYTGNAITDFRKSERPLVVDKLGTVGQMAYTYHSFLFNMMNQMGTFARNGDYKSLATMIGTMTLMGGVQNLPFVNELDGMWQIFRDHLASIKPDWYAKVKDFGTGGIKGAILSGDMPTFAKWGAVSALTHTQMASRFSPALLDVERPFDAVAPIATEMREWASVAGILAHPTKTSVAEAMYANTPPMVQGALENLNDSFGKTLPNGTRSINNPRDLEKHEAKYIRTPEEQKARYKGLKALSEADATTKKYLNNRESMRLNEARISSSTKLYDAIERNDPSAVSSYAKAYFTLGGDANSLSQFITDKVVKGNVSAEQWSQMHAQSLAKINDVKRRLDMDKNGKSQ